MGGVMVPAVIIPCRNEEATIGEIVEEFQTNLTTRGRIFVGIDEDTTDDTAKIARKYGAIVYHTGKRGKGQVVKAVLDVLKRDNNRTSRLILCDGDYRGLNQDHIARITTKRADGMVIGVPEFPDCDVPPHVISAWPWTSGFRCFPTELVPDDAHGYLLETQLNVQAIKRRMGIAWCHMPGLAAPFNWPLSEQRQRELQRDMLWGRARGIL